MYAFHMNHCMSRLNYFKQCLIVELLLLDSEVSPKNALTANTIIEITKLLSLFARFNSSKVWAVSKLSPDQLSVYCICRSLHRGGLPNVRFQTKKNV